MLLLHTKETVVAAAALLLSGWLCGVITGAPTTRCFLYFIFPYVGTPGGDTRPHPCRLSLLWGEKKGSWEKGWTWTREEAHHDGTLWGIFSYLHSDILTQQHWQFQKSLSSYCDDVSTESCFVKIKLYFVLFFWFFFTGRSVVLCFLLSSLLGKRPTVANRKQKTWKREGCAFTSLSLGSQALFCHEVWLLENFLVLFTLWEKPEYRDFTRH